MLDLTLALHDRGNRYEEFTEMKGFRSMVTGLPVVIDTRGSGVVCPLTQEPANRESEEARFSERKERDERRHPRYSAHRIVAYKYRGRRLLTVTLDLSLGDMRIRTHCYLPDGKSLDFRLVLEGGFIRLQGKIAYSGIVAKKQRVSGVEFIDLSPENSALLQKCDTPIDESPGVRCSLVPLTV